jgi:hypothetical protein
MPRWFVRPAGLFLSSPAACEFSRVIGRVLADPGLRNSNRFELIIQPKKRDGYEHAILAS